MNRKRISYGRQTIDEEDIRAVVDTLRSDWLTQGPTVKEFELALCAQFGCKNAVALSSGTAALHLIGNALGWQPGDTVITTPITFLASANCILYSGATPDFVDIDAISYTIDVNKLEEKLIDLRKKGKKVKAVIGVDFAGQPCDWKSLRYLADKFELQLVDDACHALGAKYFNEHLCAGTLVDAVALSFHPVKHITTGEGGAVLTKDDKVSEKIRILRTHGITKDPMVLERNEGGWFYEMHDLGFNYRITDFQCALGLKQLNKLDGFLQRRRVIAHQYDLTFGANELFQIPSVSANALHAYHLYPLQVHFQEMSKDRNELFVALAEKGISLQVHYIPVHVQPYYKKHFGFKQGDFPVAEEFYRMEVSMPVYPTLSEEEQEYCIRSVFEVLDQS